MKRRPKPSVPEVAPSEPEAGADAILQVKVWLVERDRIGTRRFALLAP
jgi:hypothetical protein